MEAFPSSTKVPLPSSHLRLHNSTFLSFPNFKPYFISNFFPVISQNPPFSAIAGSSSELRIQDNEAAKFQADLGSEFPKSSSIALFPDGFKYWVVNVDGPSNGFSSKAQAVDFYVDMLTKVLGNERDSQMCLYHLSWQPNFGFCCVLDEEFAQKLTGVPGVLSVHPDEHFGSETKDYGGGRLLSSAPDYAKTIEISKTKLFITGLSFYTSENTLRSAFEPFGELAEVKVIMDKISKRSKGYAFIEYTTEEAAMTALQEMNGKIINGWMIAVDRAKSTPNNSRRRPKSMSLQDRKLT